MTEQQMRFKGRAGSGILLRLIERGVRVPSPESVEIGEEVQPERVSGDRVTIHAGCKIFGARTLILPEVELGYEGPATISNCQLGKGVKLAGGFFSDSCFLSRSSMGSGAQVRGGCLLEEGTRGAHSVGLKQTILFPFVTLGSLVNFCDCFMAGGTDEKNHSEVGSSYVHFNFTPNQDKATPSLIGDVPRGVLLKQAPIFLGGQGGAVGPIRINYGTVVAAGTIVRKDILEENTLYFGNAPGPKTFPFRAGSYSGIRRIVKHNSYYIASLIALRRWYLDVRSRFQEEASMEAWLMEGAVGKLQGAVAERLKRLGEVAEKMEKSVEILRASENQSSQALIREQENFTRNWPEMKEAFEKGMGLKGEPSLREAFLTSLEEDIAQRGRDYLPVIQGLTAEQGRKATTWLQGLVDSISNAAMAELQR